MSLPQNHENGTAELKVSTESVGEPVATQVQQQNSLQIETVTGNNSDEASDKDDVINTSMYMSLMKNILSLQNQYSDEAIGYLIDMAQNFRKGNSSERFNELLLLVDSLISEACNDEQRARLDQHLQQSLAAADKATLDKEELIVKLRQQISEIRNDIDKQLHGVYSNDLSALGEIQTKSHGENENSRQVEQKT